MVNAALKDPTSPSAREGKPPLTDDEILGLLPKLTKQRQESLEIYEKAGRADLATQEREEIAIIAAFMPKQMSEAEAKAAIAAAIKDTGAASMKDMGKVMGAAEGAPRRPDGFRQGERAGEGDARGVGCHLDHRPRSASS